MPDKISRYDLQTTDLEHPEMRKPRTRTLRSDIVFTFALGIGLAISFAGMIAGRHRVARTRYRPDPWALPELLTAGAGVLAGAAFIAVGALDPAALAPSTAPLVVPPVPLLALAGGVLALLPAIATPRPPEVLR